jgi:hypothetical protein
MACSWTRWQYRTRATEGRDVVARDRRPVLITDAPENPERELRRREIRYVVMTMTRAGCLVVGAVLVSTKPPLWPLWVLLCVVGMVLLPWLAVILANDRPPRTRAERLKDAQRRQAQPTALPAANDDHEQKVIDSD